MEDRTIEVELHVNGRIHRLRVAEDARLLEVLREDLDLTGTRYGCGYGACGACTVLAGGEPVRSCTLRARDAEGMEIITVEGLARGGELHPVQAAFLEKGAFQCGYCTSGFIVAVAGLLHASRGKAPERSAIAEALEGHTCRCGVYQRILDAAESALARARKGNPGGR